MLVHTCQPKSPSSIFLLRQSTSTTITVATLSTYCNSINDRIVCHLKEVFPMHEALSIFEPLHYLTLVAPRSSAPTLCVASHASSSMEAPTTKHSSSFFTKKKWTQEFNFWIWLKSINWFLNTVWTQKNDFRLCLNPKKNYCRFVFGFCSNLETRFLVLNSILGSVRT